MKRQKVKALKPKSEPPLKMKQSKFVHYLIAAVVMVMPCKFSSQTTKNKKLKFE